MLLIARIVFGILLMNHGIQKWTNFQEPVSYTHLDVYKRQAFMKGAAIADKVIGKGAAALMVLGLSLIHI